MGSRDATNVNSALGGTSTAAGGAGALAFGVGAALGGTSTAAGNNEDGAVALLCGRRRLVLVEQRDLGWVAGTRERQDGSGEVCCEIAPMSASQAGLNLIFACSC